MSDSTIVKTIEYRSTGLDDVVMGMRALAQRCREASIPVTTIDSQIKSLSRSLSLAATNAGKLNLALDNLSRKEIPAIQSGIRFAGVQTQTARSLDSVGRSARAAVGPMQRLLEAQANYYRVARTGTNAALIMDARLQMDKAADASYRAQGIKPKPPIISDPFDKMLKTSRVAVGPNGQMQIMPILGRMMAAGMNPSVGGVLNLATEAAEGGAAVGLGAVGTAATAGALAIGAMAAAAMQAKDALISNYTAQAVAGATGQGPQLHALAGALGISDSDLAGLSSSLNQRLSSGQGFGPGIAATLGVSPYGGPGGDQNYFNKLKTLITAVTDPNRMTDQQAAFDARQIPELQQFLYLRNASPGVRNQVLTGMGSDNPIGNTQTMHDAADAQAKLNLALMDFKNVLTGIGTGLLPLLTIGAEAAGLAARPVGWLNRTAPGGIAALTMGQILGPTGFLVSALASNTGADATDSNIQAVKDNTNAIKTMANTLAANGLYGGGPRGRGAIPGGWGVTQWDQVAKGNALMLGAFTLGGA